VNDADFEMLNARVQTANSLSVGDVDASFDMRLRILAIEYALKMGTDVHASAVKFYQFMKGEVE